MAGRRGSGRRRVSGPCLPEAFRLQVVKRIVGRVLVIVLADEKETIGETVAEFPAPGDALGSGEAGIDEIESCEQQQWFVGSFVTPAPHADDADVERVESFDGGGEIHGEKGRDACPLRHNLAMTEGV